MDKPRVLHLTLFRKWFDDIARGIKKNEFRVAKPYWVKRLKGRQYDEIHIRNGYASDRPFMKIEFKGCTLCGDTFVIRLGEILEIKNWEGPQ